MKVLGIIPARAGSKGVPGKNIRQLCGKPLIWYSIESAFNSSKLSSFIVSTDGEEISKLSEKYSAEVLIRSELLAQDDTPVVNVVEDILSHYKSHDEIFDVIVLLQPTSPIRTGQDIDNIIEMFENDQMLEGVISVVAMNEVHPARMYNIDQNSNLISLNSNDESLQRQQIEPVYYRNGSIYAVRTRAFLKHHSLMVPMKKAYVMPLKWMINIDDERDFKIAEVIMKEWLTNDSVKN